MKRFTPKEKAKELVDRYTEVSYPILNRQAKECALIAVDERMKPEPVNGNIMASKYLVYWHQVKKEIEKL